VRNDCAGDETEPADGVEATAGAGDGAGDSEGTGAGSDAGDAGEAREPEDFVALMARARRRPTRVSS